MKLFTHSGQLLPQNYFKSYRSHYLNTFTDYFQLLLYLEKKKARVLRSLQHACHLNLRALMKLFTF